MTRKQLEGICRFIAMWNGSFSLDQINREFGLNLTGQVSQEKALTVYLEAKKIKLDVEGEEYQLRK